VSGRLVPKPSRSHVNALKLVRVKVMIRARVKVLIRVRLRVRPGLG